MAGVFEITLRLATNPTGRRAVSVSYDLPPDADGGKPLRLALDGLDGIGRSTDQVTDLTVSDAQGAVPMRRSDDNGSPVWTSERNPGGAVTVRYTMPVADPRPQHRGPQYDLQMAGDGVVGSGRGILLLPREIGAEKVQLRWASLPSGMSSVSEVAGEPGRGKREALLETLVAAGTFRRFPDPTPPSGLAIVGLGAPTYDLGTLFDWEKRWYEASRAALGGRADVPFRIFFRSYPDRSEASGMRLGRTLLVYLPHTLSADGALGTRMLLAHETMHLWVPNLAGDDDTDAWYHEGQAEYFSITLAWKAGLTSSRAFLDAVNRQAVTYYGGAYRNLPNDRIPSVMWTGTGTYLTPYSRGFLYLAATDARIRAHSHGRRGVIDAVRLMVERQNKGERLNDGDWRAAVTSLGGSEAGPEFDAMLAGRTITPPSQAFGKCFLRQPIRMGTFDQGYHASREPNGVLRVNEIEQGSAAAKAGLKVGDRITNAVDWNNLIGRAEDYAVLHLDDHRVIRFRPRRGGVDGFRWEPASGDVDHPCPRRSR